MASNSKKQAPEFLQNLRDNVVNVLLRHGFDQARANDIAYEVSKDQQMNWRGQIVYFPSTDPEELSKRDQEIWDKFNGSNHADLVVEFNVSLAHIYRIIKFMRVKDISKRQGSLLNE